MTTTKQTPEAMAWRAAVAGLCAFETAAITTGKVPTLSSLMWRTPMAPRCSVLVMMADLTVVAAPKLLGVVRVNHAARSDRFAWVADDPVWGGWACGTVRDDGTVDVYGDGNAPSDVDEVLAEIVDDAETPHRRPLF